VAVDTAAAIKAAAAKLGARYVWGATGPDTFDCSGLMVWAYNKVGVSLPRTSQQQAKYGTAVPIAKIQPGDLVTSNWGSGPSSHVGMYIGGGKLIHAPRPGSTVRVASLDANYRRHVDAVRRVPGASGTGQAGFDVPGLPDALEPDGGGGLPGLLKPVMGIAAALQDMAGGMLSVGKVAEFILRLALPSTWVRIWCGVLGVVLLFLGVWFLAREAWGAGG
jgi:hypothetical protein